MSRRLACLAAALLVGASPAAAQPLGESDMLRFLVQAQCLDEAGRPTAALPVDPACQRRRAQMPDDVATYRRSDWGDARNPGGLATGFQASDSLLSVPPYGQGGPATIAHTYDFGAPTGEGFGAFYAPGGDGGDVIRLEDGVASIFMTEDGGGGLQWFVGEGCRTRRASPEQAWLLFDSSVERGQWRDGVARLLITRDRDECPGDFSSAYTRWIRADIPTPFLRSGLAAGTVTLDAVVSEHYDLPQLAQSNHLERFFLARDLGKFRWERWEHPSLPDAAIYERAQDLAAAGRCPAIAHSDAPGPGWYMVDCRMWTNIVPPPPGWTPRAFAWGGLSVAAR